MTTRSRATSVVLSTSREPSTSAAKDAARDSDTSATTRKFALRQFGDPTDDFRAGSRVHVLPYAAVNTDTSAGADMPSVWRV